MDRIQIFSYIKKSGLGRIIRNIASGFGAMYLSLLHLKNEKAYMIIMPNGIGEIINIGTYLAEFARRNKTKEIVLLVLSRRISVISFIPYDDYKTIEMRWVFWKCVSLTQATTFGINFLERNRDYCLGPMKKVKTIQNTNNFIYDIKYKMNLLDFDRPRKPSCCIGKCNDADQRIYINPYARTVPSISLSFWGKLVNSLSNIGYEVITILGNNQQKAINGSREKLCSLPEAVDCLGKSSGFIGLRSGFMDLIAGLKIPIMCVYPEDYEETEFFSFKHLEYENNVREFVVTKENENEIILKIISYLKKGETKYNV